ncbi:MAG: HAMP domain-containing sensor histidine kinase [Elusimicrobia bacterium]|nr:HAMP domain-containing sensor histidine kinase [Elusimicrobiota bacterium]
MDLIYQFCKNNIDIIYFIYGFAFVMMGFAIFIQPKKGTQFKFANILWLLALFGIIHGTNEFLDMWLIIKGYNRSLEVIKLFVLFMSYFCLLEFGIRIFCLSDITHFVWRKKIVDFARWWTLLIIIFLIYVFNFIPGDFMKIGNIWTRYLLGLPSGMLSCFGILSYYKHEKEIIEPFGVKKYVFTASISLLIYSILGGLVVPKGNFSPSNWLNVDSFILVIHIPVQLFRATLALIILWSVIRIISIFNLEIESKLEESNKNLIELDKRKSEFVSMVSHELKTPLTNIIGFAQTMLSLKSNVDEQRQYLEIINLEGKRLATLVDEFLDISKIEVGNFKLQISRVNIPNLVKEAINITNVPEGIQIELNFFADFPMIYGDDNKIKQVIINILANAIRYTPKGGNISIRGESENDSVIVSIQDTGPGIKKEELEKVFEKFYRSDDEVSKKSTGSGLGLAIVKSIVEAHKGKIWAESEEGKGSKFVFILPIG